MTGSSDALERSIDSMLDGTFAQHTQIVVPWRGTSRRRGDPLYDRTVVGSFVVSCPRLIKVDPFELRSTQTWVLRSHVRYYLSARRPKAVETQEFVEADR